MAVVYLKINAQATLRIVPSIFFGWAHIWTIASFEYEMKQTENNTLTSSNNNWKRKLRKIGNLYLKKILLAYS